MKSVTRSSSSTGDDCCTEIGMWAYGANLLGFTREGCHYTTCCCRCLRKALGHQGGRREHVASKTLGRRARLLSAYFTRNVVVELSRMWDTVIGYLRQTQGLPSARGISPRFLYL